MLRPLALAGVILWAAPGGGPRPEGELLHRRHRGRALLHQRDARAGRASYSVLLRNTLLRSQRSRLVITGNFLSRPPPLPQTIRAGATMSLLLGYSPNLPGVAPLRGEQLAQVTRVTCL